MRDESFINPHFVIRDAGSLSGLQASRLPYLRLEVWIGLGGTQSAVYATEVSREEYFCYTTEETEKIRVLDTARKLGGDIEAAIKQLANE